MVRIISFFLLLLFGLATARTQVRDTRVVLDFNSDVYHMALSPDGSLWLPTENGRMYVLPAGSDAWSSQSFSRKNRVIRQGNSMPDWNQVHFFNDDIAIVTGDIRTAPNQDRGHGYYRTTDGGHSWQLQDFGGEAWFPEAFTDSSGHAWVAPQQGGLFYSQDFGATWKELTPVFTTHNRKYAVCMLDGTRGIAGGEDNHLYQTTNNWRSCTKIPTPADQGFFPQEKKALLDVWQITRWQQGWVLRQGGDVFYSPLDTIRWQAVVDNVIGYAIDRTENVLFALCSGNEVKRFTAPGQGGLWKTHRIPGQIHDMVAMNGTVLAFERMRGVWEISEEGIRRAPFYSRDYPIPIPHTTIRCGTHQVGKSGDHTLYRWDEKLGWYRDSVFAQRIQDISVIDSHAVALWLENYTTIRYDLETRTITPYFIRDPLETFLRFPVQEFSVSTFFLCGSMSGSTYTYTRCSDSLLVYNYEDEHGKKIDSQQVRSCTIDAHALEGMLRAINEQPCCDPATPGIIMDAKDLQAYETLVRKECANKSKEDLPYFLNFPQTIDSTCRPLLMDMLFGNKRIYTMTSSVEAFCSVKLTNTAGEVLYFSRPFHKPPCRWNLPWEMEKDGQHAMCCNLSFSNLVYASIPGNRDDDSVEMLDAPNLLFALAYLMRDADK